MRAILLILLLLNVGYFCSMMWAIEPEHSGGALVQAPELAGPEVSMIQKVSELAQGVLVSHEAPINLKEVDKGHADGGSSKESICAEIGLFNDLADVELFFEANASDVEMQVDVRSIAGRAEYRVYLPPLSSRDLASSALEDLRQIFSTHGLRIDTYLIPGGELENAIALGLFHEQANALNVQARLARLGYDVTVREESRQFFEYWVLLQVVDGAQFFTVRWPEMQSSRPYLKLLEKLC